MTELLANPLFATAAVIVGGIALLVGGEALVRGASKIALALRISPLVVGLTIVAVCTSAPEMAVSFYSALNSRPVVATSDDGAPPEPVALETVDDENVEVATLTIDADDAEIAYASEQPEESNDVADVAIGNVVGSNICNILLILGVCALIRPVAASESIVKRDFPIYLVLTLVVLLFAFGYKSEDGYSRLPQYLGFILLVGFVAYETMAVIQARREENAEHAANIVETLIPDAQKSGVAQSYRDEIAKRADPVGEECAPPEEEPTTTAPKPEKTNWLVSITLLVFGLAALIGGSELFVKGAVALAKQFGVSELIIGLTLVALGTSLPELVVSGIATYRRQVDVAVGNVIGSCICNIFLVLGGTIALVPQGLTIKPQTLFVDLPVMTFAGIIAAWFCLTGRKLERWEGAALLLFEVGYSVYIIAMQ